MAIKKSIELESGVKAEHWQLKEVFFSPALEVVELKFEGHLSAAAKADGKAALSSKCISVPAGQSPQLAAAVLAYAEAQLAAQADFEAAEVVADV